MLKCFEQILNVIILGTVSCCFECWFILWCVCVCVCVCGVYIWFRGFLIKILRVWVLKSKLLIFLKNVTSHFIWWSYFVKPFLCSIFLLNCFKVSLLRSISKLPLSQQVLYSPPPPHSHFFRKQNKLWLLLLFVQMCMELYVVSVTWASPFFKS